MKALKVFIKPFEVPQGTENKNLTQFLFQYNFQKCTGREKLIQNYSQSKFNNIKFQIFTTI